MLASTRRLRYIPARSRRSISSPAASARAVPLRQLHKHQSSPSLRQFSAVTAVLALFDDVSPDRRFRALSRAATRRARRIKGREGRS